MRLNTASVPVFATILLAVGAATALAQAKPTKRIPITKEAPGEVAPRVDTVMRVDTVTKYDYRTDTIVRTVVRVDSVMLTPPPVPVRLPAGFYFGVAGGSSGPDGSIFLPNSVGYLGQAHIGWQDHSQIVGARISGTYTGLGQDSRFSHGDNAKLWTLGTDLKLGLPLGNLFGAPKLSAYAIGGWTYTWFRDMPFRVHTPDGAPTVIQAGDSSWTGRNGWDAGGGLSLMWGRAEIFAESRAIGFSVPNGPQARQIPIVLGFNWF
jgi:hypothetical protein